MKHAPAVSRQTISAFRSWVTQQWGLRFEDDRSAWLAGILQRRAQASDLKSAEAYFSQLLASRLPGELDVLARELTVPETFFFRNAEHLDVLRDVVVPAWREAGQQHHPLRILSAACATGEEPYSIAMTLDAMGLRPDKQFVIDAVDINPAALEIARQARYANWSLRDTPPDMRQRWFTSDGRDHILDDRIRAMVRFTRQNLSQDDPGFWRPGRFDVVFCRNALMYFAPEQMSSALARLLQSLAPGGYFFLGYAESLRGLSSACHLRHTHGTFYYQRKTEAEMQEPERTTAPKDMAPASPMPEHAVPGVGAAELLADTAQADVARARELFAQERFDESWALLRAMAPAGPAQPAAWRLEAMLLIHGGQFRQAQDICEQLLHRDELDADAHHLLALSREGQGDADGTVDSEQTAAYLDPEFAMPHLHLGMLARRRGQRDMARRELELAARLIGREDAARVDLFGGGFGRQALSALCAAELAACGEA